jgi:hypothetical protein
MLEISFLFFFLVHRNFISSKSSGRVTLDNLVENIEKNKLAEIFKENFKPEREKMNREMHFSGPPIAVRDFVPQNMGLSLGLPLSVEPNAPIPPDSLINTPFISCPPILHNKEDTNIENENFLDASDQVGDGSSDSDMEVVKETPLGVL